MFCSLKTKFEPPVVRENELALMDKLENFDKLHYMFSFSGCSSKQFSVICNFAV